MSGCRFLCCGGACHCLTLVPDSDTWEAGSRRHGPFLAFVVWYGMTRCGVVWCGVVQTLERVPSVTVSA